MTTPEHTFLGMTIEGDIILADKKPDQLPIESLAPLIQTVLDRPLVTGIRWTQYTPYYNDGDPCIFGVNECALGLLADEYDEDDEDDDEDDEDYEPEYDEGNRYFYDYQDIYHKLVGTHNDKYDRETRKWHVHPDSPEPGLWEAHRDLNQAIQSGAYDNALFGLFGDHAIVRIRKGSNIVVTEYSHD
jgi:hypothetical protein